MCQEKLCYRLIMTTINRQSVREKIIRIQDEFDKLPASHLLARGEEIISYLNGADKSVH
jgi:hypothetical protein